MAARTDTDVQKFEARHGPGNTRAVAHAELPSAAFHDLGCLVACERHGPAYGAESRGLGGDEVQRSRGTQDQLAAAAQSQTELLQQGWRTDADRGTHPRHVREAAGWQAALVRVRDQTLRYGAKQHLVAVA